MSMSVPGPTEILRQGDRPVEVGHDGGMTSRLLYSVIPAGGSGTRLWPLSRAADPKFLHALTGSSASLLQAT